MEKEKRKCNNKSSSNVHQMLINLGKRGKWTKQGLNNLTAFNETWQVFTVFTVD
uniref:Uncharacterized protein n=1 Tax=Tetranychus urticae TaxID=32264 RepID=T1KSJ3_TETUR